MLIIMINKLDLDNENMIGSFYSNSSWIRKFLRNCWKTLKYELIQSYEISIQSEWKE